MYKSKIKKLFGRESNLQSLSHYVGTPGAETILRLNVMLLLPGVEFFASVMPTRKNQCWEDRKHHNCPN